MSKQHSSNMNPIRFRGQNALAGEGQPEYLPLPGHYGEAPFFVMTTCWRLSWLDLLRIVLTRRIWVQQLTFGERLQPQLVSSTRPAFLAQTADKTSRSAIEEEEQL